MGAKNEVIQAKNEELASEAAKELGKLGASKGGRARASVLTKEERSEIGRNAVRARWAKEKGIPIEEVGQVSDLADEPKKAKESNQAMPVELFQGKLEIGDVELLCYVLNNGKRVFAQREVVRILTGHNRGDIARYIDTPNLKPYINKDLILAQTFPFKIRGTQFLGHAFEATLLLDICDGFLRARENSELNTNQLAIAQQAETIIRSTAKVGIIALIDEATGFQKFRKEKELQFKLQAFIADDMQEWARMFPEEFWHELARLEGVRYSARNRPLRWGKYVMMFVYDAIDPEIGNHLRKINPDPHYLKNHHMWLKKFGRSKVRDQIMQVIPVMRLCRDMKDFKEKFAYVFKRAPLQLEFDEKWLLASDSEIV